MKHSRVVLVQTRNASSQVNTQPGSIQDMVDSDMVTVTDDRGRRCDSKWGFVDNKTNEQQAD